MSDSEQSHDGEFGVREDLVEVPHYKRAGTTSVDFDGLLGTPLALHEDLKEGCGGQLWPAGMVLAKYLLREPQVTSLLGKSIIELGAGGGLTGLALALKIHNNHGDGSSVGTHFTLTDQEILLHLMQHNISLNGLPESLVEAAVLDWSHENLSYKQPDVLLAADCVYFEPAFPLLLRTMKALIGPNTVCYFCFKKRRKADLRFVKEARKIFKIEDIEDDPDKPIWSRQTLFLQVPSRHKETAIDYADILADIGSRPKVAYDYDVSVSLSVSLFGRARLRVSLLNGSLFRTEPQPQNHLNQSYFLIRRSRLGKVRRRNGEAKADFSRLISRGWGFEAQSYMSLHHAAHLHRKKPRIFNLWRKEGGFLVPRPVLDVPYL